MIELSSVDKWEKILEQSNTKPFWILKHSTECMISARARRQVRSFLKSSKREDLDIYFVKVIEERKLSNQIASDTDVKHASPQLLLVQNKQVIWKTSHWKITKNRMNEALELL